MKHKNVKVIALSILASVCLGAGIATSTTAAVNANVTATADSYGNIFFEEINSFKMEGAAVRVSGTSGLRFTSSVSKTEYAELAKDYTVTMGMLIIPSNKLSGELTVDNTTDPIAKVLQDDDIGLVETDSTYEFRAVQYDFPETSYGRDMLARGFLTISDGTETKTFYTDDITRNVAYVAYKASEVDTTSAFYHKNNAVLKGYIGEKQFSKLTLPDGVTCDYDYAYAGQQVYMSVPDDASGVTFTGVTATKNGNDYTFTMGNTDVFVSAFSATVDKTAEAAIDLELSGSGASMFEINGNVTSITDGFTYSNGVLTTTKQFGTYNGVELTTDAGYTYKFNVNVITQVIDTAAKLQSFAANMSDGRCTLDDSGLAVRAGYYVLGANIDATGLTFDNNKATFSGTFDGRGYTISGATYSTSDTNAEAGGLLGELAAGSTVKNLALTNSKIYCHPYVFFGVLTGGATSFGTIDNCYVEIAETKSNVNGYTLTVQSAADACGVVAHQGGGSMTNVVVKYANSAALVYNVCGMVYGGAKISNVYVIGGGSANNGWLEDSTGSSASIANVTTMTETQFSTFDNTVWGLKNGLPYFKKSAAVDTGKSLDICLKAEDKAFGSKYIHLQNDLGLSGTVTSVTDGFGNVVPFVVSGEYIVLSPVALGEQTMYITMDGVRYAFKATVITQVIDTVAELQQFATNGNDNDCYWDYDLSLGVREGYYVLGANIDNAGWISNGSALFKGTFDGRGHTISGAYIVSGGLFGNIAQNATVKNLAFINTEYGFSEPGSAFCSDNNGTIDNCYIEVVKQGYDTNGTLYEYCALSAFANNNYGTISNCVSVLPEWGSSQHKAVCQYNYGHIENVYCMGTETETTYSGNPCNGTEQNIVKTSTMTETQFSTFNKKIWMLENGIPSFISSKISDWSTYTDLGTVETENGTEISFATLGVASVSSVWSETHENVGNVTATGVTFPVSTAGESAFYYLLSDNTLYGVRVFAITQIIDTAAELQAFAAGSQTGYYVLGANIDATGLSFSNAGTFTGTFDGRGHTIGGAYITNGGLFGNIAQNATVKNLAFINTEYGYSGPGSAFCKNNNGTIDNCYIEVVKQGYDTNGTLYEYCALSAFADENNGTISNCVSVLPEWSTDLHYAVCEYNYGRIENVYCMGTESSTTYSIPGQGTEVNLVLVTNKTGALPAITKTGFNATYWTMSVGNRPQFKGIEYALTENGASDYCIIYDDESTISTEAAQEIQKYFAIAAGVELTLLKKGEYEQLTAHYISVGFTYQLDNITGLWNMTGSGTTGEDELGLGSSGYIVDVVEGNVYIIGFYKGTQPHGTKNGAYAWLAQQFGLTIYSEDSYTIEEGCTDEKLEIINKVEKPDVAAVIGGNSDSYGNTALGYYTINGSGNGLVAGAFGNGIRPFHNFLDFLPQATTQSNESNPNGVEVDINYGTTLGTARKNDFSDGYSYYYDNAYGNRNVYDLCLAQNEATMIPYLLDRMYTLINYSGAGHYKYIAFTHEDGSFWCPHCRKKYAQGNTGYATENEYITAIYTQFMIRLANEMAKDSRFANVSLIMADYGLANKLPVQNNNGVYTLDSGIQAYMTANNLTLPTNLVVAYSYNVVNNYDGAEDFSAAQDAIARWKTVTDRFYLWTYIENYENYFAPFDGLEQIQASMQFAKSCNAEVYYPQGMSGIGTTSIDWGALENYVIAQLAWDVNANVDTLIDNFFDGYYGAAATQMKALYTSYKTKMKDLGKTYGFGGTYNLLSKDGVSYISTKCWSQTELEGFLDQIKAAYTALDTAKSNGSIDETTYNELKTRVNVEELTFKYLYIKLYISDANSYYGVTYSTTLKSNFISECKALGVTNFSEGKELTTDIF